MPKPVFNTVLDQFKHEREVQQYKYAFTYPINAAIANNSSQPISLSILEDADFRVERITLSAYGPTDQYGVRQVSASTNFPLAGIATGYADRGLQVKITDKGNSKDLTNGFVGLELFGSPGYGVQMHLPLPYTAMFIAASQIIFEFKNRDTATGDVQLYHFVSLALHGNKYALGSNLVGKRAV